MDFQKSRSRSSLDWNWDQFKSPSMDLTAEQQNMSVPGTVPGICVAALPNVAPIQQIVDVRFGYRAHMTSSDFLLAEREPT
jgi:hypothetical protein